jgi:hypothetical protein
MQTSTSPRLEIDASELLERDPKRQAPVSIEFKSAQMPARRNRMLQSCIGGAVVSVVLKVIACNQIISDTGTVKMSTKL